MTEIEGKITNAGDRNVKQAEVNCVFYNVYGEVVLRERVSIVKGALKPGETQKFPAPVRRYSRRAGTIRCRNW